jgi:hypothetical protein
VTEEAIPSRFTQGPNCGGDDCCCDPCNEVPVASCFPHQYECCWCVPYALCMNLRPADYDDEQLCPTIGQVVVGDTGGYAFTLFGHQLIVEIYEQEDYDHYGSTCGWRVRSSSLGIDEFFPFDPPQECGDWYEYEDYGYGSSTRSNCRNPRLEVLLSEVIPDYYDALPGQIANCDYTLVITRYERAKVPFVRILPDLPALEGPVEADLPYASADSTISLSSPCLNEYLCSEVCRRICLEHNLTDFDGGPGIGNQTSITQRDMVIRDVGDAFAQWGYDGDTFRFWRGTNEQTLTFDCPHPYDGLRKVTLSEQEVYEYPGQTGCLLEVWEIAEGAEEYSGGERWGHKWISGPLADPYDEVQCGIGFDVTIKPDDEYGETNEYSDRYVRVSCNRCSCWKKWCGNCRCSCQNLCVTRISLGSFKRQIVTWDEERLGWYDLDEYGEEYGISLIEDVEQDCGCALSIPTWDPIPIDDCDLNLSIEQERSLSDDPSQSIFCDYEDYPADLDSTEFYVSVYCAPCGSRCVPGRGWCGDPDAPRPETLYLDLEGRPLPGGYCDYDQLCNLFGKNIPLHWAPIYIQTEERYLGFTRIFCHLEEIAGQPAPEPGCCGEELEMIARIELLGDDLIITVWPVDEFCTSVPITNIITMNRDCDPFLMEGESENADFCGSDSYLKATIRDEEAP